MTTSPPSGHQPHDSAQLLSGLNGKALRNLPVSTYPSMPDVLRAIPKHCFEKDTAKSLMYAAISTGLTVACAALAAAYLPLSAAWTPAWVLYALVNGTIATGCWVVAHECGHGAFSDNKTLQDTIGYILHSCLLVPYFSWQRSHAVHHARTNHIDEGETHVPMRASEADGRMMYTLKERLGEPLFGVVNMIAVLGAGWPVYLLTGASGGPVRGKTNHFWPYAGAQGRHALFPGKWASKVLLSDVGVFAVIAGLGYWAYAVGSIWPVIALYVGPLLITNAWLVAYTWLQHTDVDVPHFGGDDWSPVKGALSTIDRPYGPIFDFLHHRIGSTHVAHHVNHAIPHYHALEATQALQKAFPEYYLADPTPIHVALWRIVTKCVAVNQRPTGEWVFAPQR
jgi:fatty acid desaturase